MVSCAVADCENNEKTPNVSFHRIPKIPELRSAWVDACNRKDGFFADFERVCSSHFSKDDFKPNMKDRFGFPSRRRLKRGTIPHLNLTKTEMVKCNEEIKMVNMPSESKPADGVMEVDLTDEKIQESKSYKSINNNNLLKSSIWIDNLRMKFKTKNGFDIDSLFTACEKEVGISNYIDEFDPILQGIESTTASANEVCNEAEIFRHRIINFLTSTRFIFMSPVDTLRTSSSFISSLLNQSVTCIPSVAQVKEPTAHEGLEIVTTVSTKSNLPPSGELIRSKLQIGSKVFAMKGNPLGVWTKAVVMALYDSSDGLSKTYKIRFMGGSKCFTRNVTGKYLAYDTNSNVIIPVGTRIVSRYTDPAGRSAHYSGVVAEPPKATNFERYLVFYEDGCAQYVKHEDVYVVCAQSNDVVEDVHENIKDFLKGYLLSYPERPMVKLQRNQLVKTEYNQEWSEARVVDVDCSMVKMYFLSSQRVEWIYRGSTRLKPLCNELANAKAHRLEGKCRRRHFATPRKPHQPYVEYTREDVINIDSEEEGSNVGQSENGGEVKRRNTARKSTTSHSKPSAFASSGGPIFHNLQDKKSHSGSKEIYIRDSYIRTKYVPHNCGVHCREREEPAVYKGNNPFIIPIKLGWERQMRRFRVAGPGAKVVVTYRAPCGRHLRDLQDVLNYLNVVKSRITIDYFSFCANVWIFRTFRPKETFYYCPDMTEGKENVPVPCVNSLNGESPPFVEYSSERFPGKGVFLNLDQNFLCGCTCTDNCQNPATCECQQQTNFAKPDQHVGYKFRRLAEAVVTGIYECNLWCKCNSQCGNRVVQNGLTVRLQMFKTQYKGWGIRCLDDIDAGQFICVYAGQLLTEQGADADGKECGDEYLAELDFIEVVEKTKEGYESDVAEDTSMELDDTDVKVEKEEEEDEEEEIKVEEKEKSESQSSYSDIDVVGTDTDSEFESSSLRTTATSTYATRSRLKKKNTKNKVGGANSSEDSNSGSDQNYKDLPNISMDWEKHKLEPQPLDPELAEAVDKIELRRKPKMSNGSFSFSADVKEDPDHPSTYDDKESGSEKEGSRTIAKKSGFMRNPLQLVQEKKDKYRFKSVRHYFGEDSLYLMDAKTKGNIGRYLNHSCEPNVFVQNVFVDTHDLRFPAVAFFSHTSIQAGTELTWDYNYEVGSVADKVMYCYCEGMTCRGRLL